MSEPEHETASGFANGELPEGWAHPRLGDGVVNDIQPGFACGVNNRAGEGIAHLRPMNVSENGKIALTDVKFVPTEKAAGDRRLLQRGDVLFNNTNSTELVGKTAYYDDEQPRAFSNHMTRVRCEEGALWAPYCALALHHRWQEGYFQLVCNQHVSQSSVSRTRLLETPIPLPPLAEQKRIVAAIERLFEQLRGVRARLGRVPAILKRFRQSVLAAACSGRLTEDWREEEDRADDADGLAEQALSHRREYWEKAQVEKLRARGKSPANGKWKSRDEGAEPWETEYLQERPHGWGWLSLRLLGQNPLSPVQTGPFGAQLHNDEFTESGTPVIAVGNLTGMGFTTEGLYFITEEKAAQLSRYDIQAGDVLFARSGATLGKVCVAPSFVKDWRMTGHILRVRLNPQFILPELAVYALHGDPVVQDQVHRSIRGITRPGFNTALLESIRLPVAPVSEQHEIVRRVEALFRLADEIEERVAQAAARAEKLQQAILAKAFRGELVPTEAHLARQEGRPYEPASELLERIKAERERQESPSQRARRKRPRKA